MLDVSTLSEQHFVTYCKARQYRADKITPTESAGRFPDYEVSTSAGSVIVEIKEFTPNDEDHAFAGALDAGGTASFSNRSIGKRVRKAISDAAPQLRRYKESPLPEVLLLYDNMASDSYGGINDYLDPMNIGAGMFGEPVIRFWRDPSLKPPGTPGAKHGGRRQLTETTRLYIGALGVMKVAPSGQVHIDFFHNPFSTKPVWPRYFLHPDDHHYVKPDHPDRSEWAWDEFVGDREST
jgi:hypothetical protein